MAKRTTGYRDKYKMAENYVSENYQTHIKPYLGSDTAQILEMTNDFEYMRHASKAELISVASTLSAIANRRIGSFKASKYYKAILMGEDKPIPMAYRSIQEENKGKITKFLKGKNVEEMRMGELKKEIANIRNFLMSESSVLGSNKRGFYRIMNERYKNFVQGVADKANIPSKELAKSTRFQELFWRVYNKIGEGNYKDTIKYDKGKYLGTITEEIMPLMQRDWRMYDQESVVSDIVEKVRTRLDDMYRKERRAEIEDDDDSNILTRNIRKGFKSGGKE